MPRKKRKWSRPGIPTLIEDMAESAERQATGAAHAVYAILDPTQPDPFGKFRYLPIYVGVSCEIRRRVKKHFRRASYNPFGSPIAEQLRKLLQRGIVAEFEVIDRLDTKVDAMIAETAHAQRLLKAGYRLCNCWYFQHHILTNAEMEKVIARIRYAAEMERRGW